MTGAGIYGRPNSLRRHGGDAERAENAEQALAGANLDQPPSWRAASAALSNDFTPLTDMRATAAYRTRVAANLLEKALMEISGASAPTRIGMLHAAE